MMDEVAVTTFRKQTVSLALRCFVVNLIVAAILFGCAWVGSFTDFYLVVLVFLGFSPFIFALSASTAWAVVMMNVPEETALVGGPLGVFIGSALSAYFAVGMELDRALSLVLWLVVSTGISLIPAVVAKFVYRREAPVAEPQDE